MTDTSPARFPGLKVAVGFTLAVWAFEMAAYLGLVAFTPPGLQWRGTLTVFTTIAIGVLLSAFPYAVAVRTRSARAPTRYAAVGATAAACTVLVVLADVAANVFYARLFGANVAWTGERLLTVGWRTAIEITWVSGTLAAVYLVIQTERIVTERERELAEARAAASDAAAAAHQAQVAALRFQLNPHFLFNTLNALSSLVVTNRNADAEQMIGRLADFLRASLSSDPDAEVPLDDELATLQAYLEVESVRFGDRLAVEVSAPAGLLDALVPSFVLQPLVENAIKYGVAPSRRNVTVGVSAREEEGDLVLSVEDDGRAAFGAVPKGGTGVGHDNLRRRLQALYGARGNLDATASDRGFTATVRLPLHRAATPALAA